MDTAIATWKPKLTKTQIEQERGSLIGLGAAIRDKRTAILNDLASLLIDPPSKEYLEAERDKCESAINRICDPESFKKWMANNPSEAQKAMEGGKKGTTYYRSKMGLSDFKRKHRCALALLTGEITWR